MKTIEQRAKERLSNYSDSCYLHKSEETEDAYLDGFSDGAISQRKIDIDKACKVFCWFCIHQCTDYPHEDCQVLIELKEAMENE